EYCNEEFIALDPIQIPHYFIKKEDIEIAGFLSASIAWGQRPVILKNAKTLMNLMEFDPHNFILQHSPADLLAFNHFRHRTMLPVDIKFFISALKNIYLNHGGLESVITKGYLKGGIKTAWIELNKLFFSIDYPERTRKHLSNPAKNSAAKRLNMFLRWMVRKDQSGIDFGLWKGIPSSALMLPLDVHTARNSRKLGLLTRKSNDWKAVEEVSANLRILDPYDPIKYDFALFGMGVYE
ncbi:MAG: TIGR02757 family protein, partial [Bacteroidales bacterium]|nr:TIGR02757 family protein [Bacteroidales bacterium]